MFEYLYQWVKNIAFYMVILTAVMQLLPNNSYKKYIRFFVGLILITMLSEPILKLLHMEQSFRQFYQEAEYEQKMKEIKEATKYWEELQHEDE